MLLETDIDEQDTHSGHIEHEQPGRRELVELHEPAKKFNDDVIQHSDIYSTNSSSLNRQVPGQTHQSSVSSSTDEPVSYLSSLDIHVDSVWHICGVKLSDVCLRMLSDFSSKLKPSRLMKMKMDAVPLGGDIASNPKKHTSVDKQPIVLRIRDHSELAIDCREDMNKNHNNVCTNVGIKSDECEVRFPFVPEGEFETDRIQSSDKNITLSNCRHTNTGIKPEDYIVKVPDCCRYKLYESQKAPMGRNGNLTSDHVDNDNPETETIEACSNDISKRRVKNRDSYRKAFLNQPMANNLHVTEQSFGIYNVQQNNNRDKQQYMIDTDCGSGGNHYLETNIDDVTVIEDVSCKKMDSSRIYHSLQKTLPHGHVMDFFETRTLSDHNMHAGQNLFTLNSNCKFNEKMPPYETRFQLNFLSENSSSVLNKHMTHQVVPNSSFNTLSDGKTSKFVASSNFHLPVIYQNIIDGFQSSETMMTGSSLDTMTLGNPRHRHDIIKSPGKLTARCAQSYSSAQTEDSKCETDFDREFQSLLCRESNQMSKKESSYFKNPVIIAKKWDDNQIKSSGMSPVVNNCRRLSGSKSAEHINTPGSIWRGVQRRALSKEWKVVTVTTTEDVMIVQPLEKLSQLQSFQNLAISSEADQVFSEIKSLLESTSASDTVLDVTCIEPLTVTSHSLGVTKILALRNSFVHGQNKDEFLKDCPNEYLKPETVSRAADDRWDAITSAVSEMVNNIQKYSAEECLVNRSTQEEVDKREDCNALQAVDDVTEVGEARHSHLTSNNDNEFVKNLQYYDNEMYPFVGENNSGNSEQTLSISFFPAEIYGRITDQRINS